MENQRELNLDEMEKVSGGKGLLLYTTRFYTKASIEFNAINMQNACPNDGHPLYENQCNYCYTIWVETAENV